jgi:ribosomal protein S27AE
MSPPGFFASVRLTLSERQQIEGYNSKQETAFMFENLQGSKLDRRSFLRGSAMFAAAIGVAVLPAFAQQQPQQPKPEEDQDREKEPRDPFADGEKGGKKEEKLIDAEGREYRVCPQCGNNMYKQGRMWVCENCGYSYVE